MSKANSNYYGVILAAGAGSRMQPLSFDYPKPLLPICNKPIIQYQIETMIDFGIDKIFIVCGHLKEALQAQFQNGGDLGISIQYIEQAMPLGIAHALAKVEQHVDRPFLLFLGDIFFVTKDMHKIPTLFEQSKACGVLAVKQESNPEYIKRNYAVLLHESGTVRRVVEKPRYISNNLKGCGIYFFDLPIFDAVRRTPRTAMRDEYEITSSIQILIDDGYPIYPAEVIEWDMNVTVVADLVFSNMRMLKMLNKNSEIGKNVRLHPEAKIMHSVIGNNVVVENPIAIQDSVIMDETIVKSKKDLKKALVMRDLVFRQGLQD